MYTLGLKADFIARHYLIGGDWGAEMQPHAHRYVLELRLSSPELDEHEYLVDLVEVEAHMKEIVEIHRDSMLNDLGSFSGRNPSLELFCRILWDSFALRLTGRGIVGMTVRLWENDSAWAEWSGAPG